MQAFVKGASMIGRLNHIAIAVKDIAAASAVYRDTLGTPRTSAARLWNWSRSEATGLA